MQGHIAVAQQPAQAVQSRGNGERLVALLVLHVLLVALHGRGHGQRLAVAAVGFERVLLGESAELARPGAVAPMTSLEAVRLAVAAGQRPQSSTGCPYHS
jgi:hypothetical protein